MNGKTKWKHKAGTMLAGLILKITNANDQKKQKGIIMFIIRINLNVIEHKHLEVTQTLISLSDSVSRETGCKGYSVFCDILDRNRFSLIEEWQTREDLDLHIKSNLFGVLLGTKPLLSKPLDIMIYTVSNLQRIAAIEPVLTNGVPYDEYIVNLS